MQDVITWISDTSLNVFLRDRLWLIQVLQTIHIFAICVVLSSVLLLNFRLVGIIGAGEAKDVFTRRYLPWVWSGLVVLLVSGFFMIYAEPERDLVNWVFWTKMSLLVLAVALTAILERPVLKDANYWETGGRRMTSRVLAAASISCWIAIALCGRWIAYTWYV